MLDTHCKPRMISDFFHPAVGGVENHIYMLSANLIRRGHKVRSTRVLHPISRIPKKKCISQVIVITHSHADRVGVRWLLPALKVYYIPFLPIASSATLPNFFTSLPYIRTILLREHIRLIHAHASLSSMGHEGILHSHLMGIRTVFTDHSLFGFDDAASILTNKLMVGTLKNVDAIICVSHTGSVFFFPLRSIDRERYIFFFVVERTPCFVVSSSNEARRTQLALKFEKTSM